MKVLIALASRPAQLAGVQRHAINLARCLLTRSDISGVHLVIAPWQQSFVRDFAPHHDSRLHLHTAPIRTNSLSRNMWFLAQLPKLAARLDADIVHLAYPVPVRRGVFHCPTVVTLHDLYPYDIPENFGFPKVMVQRAILQQCLRGVDAIACVSASTLSRLKTLDPRLARKAAVVQNSVEPSACPSDDAPPPEWGTDPFLLCVAQHRRNKNIPLALRVFESLLRAGQLSAETRLLIVGSSGPETAAIEGLIAASGLSQRVVLLNGISDAQLQWYYRNCIVVLSPSTHEGFGLPVAEALLAGCRVVCSDIPPFRELGGNHCYYFPLGLGELGAFANAVCRALCKKSPAPVALPQLSASVIAAEYMQLYRSLLHDPAQQAEPIQAGFTSSEERQNLI